MKETKSIKVDMKVYKKVKRHAAKSKQTIGGLFELGAESLLSPNQEFIKWKEKADKWDALADKIADFYPGEDGFGNETPPKNEGDLMGIGEVAATAFGFL